MQLCYVDWELKLNCKAFMITCDCAGSYNFHTYSDTLWQPVMVTHPLTLTSHVAFD